MNTIFRLMPLICCVLAGIPALRGQALESDVKIIGPLDEGAAAVATAEARPDLLSGAKVLETRELPWAGGGKLVLQAIAPPPAFAAPLPGGASPARAEEPKADAAPAPASAAKPVRLIFLSAVVQEGGGSFLQWEEWGRPGRTVQAWSTIDFHHLSVLPGFEADGVEYLFLFSVARAGAPDFARSQAAPALPARGAGGPAFALVDSPFADEDLLAPVRGLHALYQQEGPRLAAAAAKRDERLRKQEQEAAAAPPPTYILRHWREKAPRRR